MARLSQPRLHNLLAFKRQASVSMLDRICKAAGIRVSMPAAGLVVDE